MRGKILIFSMLLSLTGCGNTQTASLPQKGLHTVDGAVPFYIEGAVAKTKPPEQSPDLIDEARTMKNLGDALRVLGPAYVAANDPMQLAVWNFSNGETLILWPRGGERLSDAVHIFPNPNCRMHARECKELVLGRQVRTAGTNPDSQDDSYDSDDARVAAMERQTSYYPQQSQTSFNNDQPTYLDKFGSQVMSTTLSAGGILVNGLAQRAVGR